MSAAPSKSIPRGLRKKKGARVKSFARDKPDGQDVVGDRDDGGASAANSTLKVTIDAAPDADVKVDAEVKEREESGGQSSGEPESPAIVVLVEKEKTLAEDSADKEKVADEAVQYNAPKQSRRSRAKQRREGVVGNRGGGDTARDAKDRSFEKNHPLRARSNNDSGGLGGGVSGGAMAAAEALAEYRGTDEHEEGRGGIDCESVGPCLRCDESDLDVAYCKETGRRQEVRCTLRDAPGAFGIMEQEGQAGVIGLPSSIQYRSCEHTDEDELQGLARFWVMMILLGVVACFGMRKRQKNIRSLYDQRAM